MGPSPAGLRLNCERATPAPGSRRPTPMPTCPRATTGRGHAALGAWGAILVHSGLAEALPARDAASLSVGRPRWAVRFSGALRWSVPGHRPAVWHGLGSVLYPQDVSTVPLAITVSWGGTQPSALGPILFVHLAQGGQMGKLRHGGCARVYVWETLQTVGCLPGEVHVQNLTAGLESRVSGSGPRLSVLLA